MRAIAPARLPQAFFSSDSRILAAETTAARIQQSAGSVETAVRSGVRQLQFSSFFNNVCHRWIHCVRSSAISTTQHRKMATSDVANRLFLYLHNLSHRRQHARHCSCSCCSCSRVQYPTLEISSIFTSRRRSDMLSSPGLLLLPVLVRYATTVAYLKLRSQPVLQLWLPLL